MKKIFLAPLALLLCACISVDVASTPTAAPLGFVTATLPPTKAGYVPPTVTASPAITSTPTFVVTIDPDCKDSAVLLRDVTIPDGTQIKPGETFTKTWEFINNGSCPWYGYNLKFAAGDQMNAPLSAPIAETLTRESVLVSVELTAPATNGAYTGYFTLNDPRGKDVPIGAEKTFWVKIVVGNNPSPQATSSGGINPTVASGGSANCKYSQNAGYINQIAAQINQERANAGLPSLSVDSVLTSAAQGQAAYMACNGIISHTGEGGSSVYTRVLAAGYSPAYVEEIIYGGGGPQAALTWWLNDQIHRDAILSAKSTQMGLGYAYFANGSYGDYFVVVFATP